jgi:hypothetical protein
LKEAVGVSVLQKGGSWGHFQMLQMFDINCGLAMINCPRPAFFIPTLPLNSSDGATASSTSSSASASSPNPNLTNGESPPPKEVPDMSSATFVSVVRTICFVVLVWFEAGESIWPCKLLILLRCPVRVTKDLNKMSY